LNWELRATGHKRILAVEFSVLHSGAVIAEIGGNGIRAIYHQAFSQSD
jgi:light-regulated signal transduction histidine kinase (bacteriophytochrome)